MKRSAYWSGETALTKQFRAAHEVRRPINQEQLERVAAIQMGEDLDALKEMPLRAGATERRSSIERSALSRGRLINQRAALASARQHLRSR